MEKRDATRPLNVEKLNESTAALATLTSQVIRDTELRAQGARDLWSRLREVVRPVMMEFGLEEDVRDS